ncbi:MAG: hypothetical protein ACK55Z_34725, partial [bacterium]
NGLRTHAAYIKNFLKRPHRVPLRASRVASQLRMTVTIILRAFLRLGERAPNKGDPLSSSALHSSLCASLRSFE